MSFIILGLALLIWVRIFPTRFHPPPCVSEEDQRNNLAFALYTLLPFIERYCEGHREKVGWIDLSEFQMPAEFNPKTLEGCAFYKDKRMLYVLFEQETPGLSGRLKALFSLRNQGGGSVGFYRIGYNRGGTFIAAACFANLSESNIGLPEAIPEGILLLLITLQ